MLQALASTAKQLLNDLRRSWVRGGRPAVSPRPVAARVAATYVPLQRVLLTDGVGRTLFEEYARHRAASRGEEETGWVLLGLREAAEAIVLATLPAGVEPDASVAHIRFTSAGQVVASRIVRQADRRLTILGVVHTHPGSLRHPSDGDYRGDRDWVWHLRGKEGVFGIGTADGAGSPEVLFAYQPRPHVQCLGALRFSWYTLRHDDGNYRPVPVDITLGPDLARPLHPLWAVLETHAERIERLYKQQANLTFEVTSDEWGPGLVLTLPLAESGDAVRVLVRQKEVRYYVVRGGEIFAVDLSDDCIDRGVYLLLAELSARP
jgi:proteasome lid subunit RPN8/RPN11